MVADQTPAVGVRFLRIVNDNFLNITLAHEFKRCKDSFSVYLILHDSLLRGKTDENIKIGTYNAYVDFVSHLYEFYLACIINDSRYPKKPSPEQIDAAMHTEASRHLKIRKERILRGDGPTWDHLSYYEVTIPNEFGKGFRKVRNLRSHVNPQRLAFNLGDFYNKYHRFLYIMYEECIWLWDTDQEGVPKQDWGEIENFTNAIIPARAK